MNHLSPPRRISGRNRKGTLESTASLWGAIYPHQTFHSMEVECCLLVVRLRIFFKCQDYTFVLEPEARKRKENFLPIYSALPSPASTLGFRKGGRGERIGGRGTANGLLRRGSRTHWPKKENETKVENLLALCRHQLSLLPNIILCSLMLSFLWWFALYFWEKKKTKPKPTTKKPPAFQ